MTLLVFLRLKGISGVGISFGLIRIALVMEELNFSKNNQQTTVLFANFGTNESLYCYKAIQTLRANGISAELYPDSTKLKNKITYANKRNIPYVVLVGEEVVQQLLYLKNMTTGTQETVDFPTLQSRIIV